MIGTQAIRLRSKRVISSGQLRALETNTFGWRPLLVFSACSP